MSKLENLGDYPPRSLATTEAALLTVWPALELFHDDLVLIGGLAGFHRDHVNLCAMCLHPVPKARRVHADIAALSPAAMYFPSRPKRPAPEPMQAPSTVSFSV